MEYEFSFYSTYGWYPLSVEAAIANIEYILKYKNELEKNTNDIGQYFTERLSQMRFRYPAEIKVKGLAVGVKFKQGKYANEIVKRCSKKGVLFALLNDKTFVLLPALNIHRDNAKIGLDIIERCL